MVSVEYSSLSKISQTASFARLLGAASSKQFYVIIGEMGDNNESKLSWAGWANSESVDSMGPYFANCKAGELLYLNQGQVLSKTPIPSFERGHGYKGGVCYLNSYVAVSILSQEHDELFTAVILYYHLFGGLKLHHIGIACNEKDFNQHNQNFDGCLKNKPDLFRFYVPQNISCFGKSYIEYFFDPKEPQQQECHFDFVVEFSILIFLNYKI